MGRLVREPETRYTQGNTPMSVTKYTLAIDRKVKKGAEKATDFINCVAFGRNGEFAEKYFRKGMKVLVEGRWQTGSYKNKDGLTVYTNDCIVDSQDFVESKSAVTQETTPLDSNTSFVEVSTDDDDLPF